MKKKTTVILCALAAVLLAVAVLLIVMGPFDERGLEYTVNADGTTCTITSSGKCKIYFAV